ncbi:MAG TPA: MarR family transcriptional regulator [Pyrinomonadaceae bacterium]|nr:MarR family transcriptional regulator [Pyrinomonadaceae bacterium]
MRNKETKKNNLSKLDYEKLAAFRYTLRQFLKFSEDEAQSAGLTPQQHQALLAIKGFPGREQITNKELAEWLQIKHHSAVGLVNRLESQNLISRQQSNTDKREVYIMLTNQGAALLERLSAAHQKELQQIASQLSRMLESFTKA